MCLSVRNSVSEIQEDASLIEIQETSSISADQHCTVSLCVQEQDMLAPYFKEEEVVFYCLFGLETWEMENKSNILMGRYEVGRLLGQGTFARVYYARGIQTNQSVAIKVVDKDKILKVGLIEQIKREISVMRLVRHPNVVHLYEVMATKTKIYFVMEYAKGGELFHKISKGKLKEDMAHKYFQQLINVVDFCHSRGVYHRDIKPENLLLDESGNLKVSDFGLSALAESRRQDGLLHTTCGTPAYVAPEVINRKGYDGAMADIWSCGVVLFVLLAGYLPFQDSNLMELYRKIGKADYKCPNWFPPETRRLLRKILNPNPDARISIEKIKENSWFKRGLRSPPECIKTETESKDDGPKSHTTGTAAGSGPSGSCEEGVVNKPPNLNAFDIISLSSGFNLSGLFGDVHKKEARFTSKRPASFIISKLEEMGKHLRLRVQKKEPGIMKLEGMKKGRNGILSIDAEIFEITPCFHLVEMKKSNGDTLEYERKLEEEIRPALNDIVWVWQGEEQHSHLVAEEL